MLLKSIKVLSIYCQQATHKPKKIKTNKPHFQKAMSH